MHKSKMIAEWYAEKSKMWNTFYDTRRIKYTDIPSLCFYSWKFKFAPTSTWSVFRDYLDLHLEIHIYLFEIYFRNWRWFKVDSRKFCYAESNLFIFIKIRNFVETRYFYNSFIQSLNWFIKFRRSSICLRKEFSSLLILFYLFLRKKLFVAKCFLNIARQASL